MFQIGDIITGNDYGPLFPYSITTSKAIMSVADLVDPSAYDDEDIYVEIIEHTDHPEYIGHKFAVNSEYFTLVSSTEYSKENPELDDMFGGFT